MACPCRSPCHICTGTGLTPATCAPGLGALMAACARGIPVQMWEGEPQSRCRCGKAIPGAVGRGQVIVALRSLVALEEITFDYALSAVPHTLQRCECGRHRPCQHGACYTQPHSHLATCVATRAFAQRLRGADVPHLAVQPQVQGPSRKERKSAASAGRCSVRIGPATPG